MGVITTTEFERLRPTGTIIPRLYGLPKVHKEGTPLRPILDMSNSPYHNLAKWPAHKLKPLKDKLSCYSVLDSFHFTDNVKNMNILKLQMFSLDVSSLFTSVPLHETIIYICDYIESNDFEIGIPVVQLRELLTLCTYNIQFMFNDSIYRQKDGVAMGSPLGPLLADIFMSKIERGNLQSSISNFASYNRYVDDIVCFMPKDSSLSSILNTFNGAHPNIKFTIETEGDEMLSFLDVHLIRREDGSLKRRVFRKSTWNGQYIHFDSFTPLTQKRNLIRCLTERALKIWTNDTLQLELRTIEEIFEQNGYPTRFVKHTMESVTIKPKIITAEKKQVCVA